MYELIIKTRNERQNLSGAQKCKQRIKWCVSILTFQDKIKDADDLLEDSLLIPPFSTMGTTQRL